MTTNKTTKIKYKKRKKTKKKKNKKNSFFFWVAAWGTLFVETPKENRNQPKKKGKKTRENK